MGYRVEVGHCGDEKYKWVVWHGRVSLSEICEVAKSEFPLYSAKELVIESESQLVILRNRGSIDPPAA